MRKTKLYTLLAAVLCCGLFTLVTISSGCALIGHNGSGGLTPERAYRIARLAAYSSTVGYSIAQPQSVPGLIAARNGFCALKAAETWDITAAAAIAQKNGLNLLDSTEGKLILGAVPLLLDTFTNESFDLKKQEYARAAINGICEGMSLAPLGDTRGKPRVGAGADPVLHRLKKEAEATRRLKESE